MKMSNIKKYLIGIGVSCIMMLNMGITASAADYTLTFTTGTSDFNGNAACIFYNEATGETKTEVLTFTNGVATMSIDDTGTYNKMEFTLCDADGTFITRQVGYDLDTITDNVRVSYDVASKVSMAESEQAAVDNVAVLANMLGISYEEALKMVQGEGNGYNPAPVVTTAPPQTNEPAVTTVPIATESKLYDFTIDYDNIQWVYDNVSVIDIEHNGVTTRVTVTDNKFKYQVEQGEYVIKAEGFVPTKLVVDSSVATRVVLKPERIVYLLKDTEQLNLTFDGRDWSGVPVNGKVAFGILPTDSVLIDDKDGKAYKLGVQPGIHEYTLDLNTGVANSLLNEKPTADITEDNPFGIPQTGDKTAERARMAKDLIVISGIVLCWLYGKFIVKKQSKNR